MNLLKTLIFALLTSTVLSCNSTKSNKEADKTANNDPFNCGTWKNSDVRTKGKMTENILNDSLLLDKSSKEILELLGEPDQETESQFHYTVDIGVTFWDDAWMHFMTVEFDSTDKVQDVWISD